jgi:cytochrome P450
VDEEHVQTAAGNESILNRRLGMTAVRAGAGGEERCPYPVHDFDTGTTARQVLSHAEEIDQFRVEHPFFRSTNGNGFWVFTDAELIRDALQHPAMFSSSVVTVQDPDPPYKWIPEMLDPPEHTVWRQLLAPHFAPKAMERLEAKVRERCASLIGRFADAGHCDFQHDFAWRYPTTIFMELMGLPMEGLEQFLDWEHKILHPSGADDPEQPQAFEAMLAVMGYFAELIEEKRRSPTDDLLSASLEWRIDGDPISLEDLLSWCLLMFMAGLDTVSIQLAYAFWHLARCPEDRARIVKDPSVVPAAAEEFLRHFAFVAPSRKVMQDADFHGCPLEKGDMVFVPLSGATRDPVLFEDAATVRLDRTPNNHIAFGAGPHRCLGSHLARRELRVALEEWHRLIPDYHLTEGVEVTEHGGGLYGIDRLELSWDV